MFEQEPQIELEKQDNRNFAIALKEAQKVSSKLENANPKESKHILRNFLIFLLSMSLIVGSAAFYYFLPTISLLTGNDQVAQIQISDNSRDAITGFTIVTETPESIISPIAIDQTDVPISITPQTETDQTNTTTPTTIPIQITVEADKHPRSNNTC